MKIRIEKINKKLPSALSVVDYQYSESPFGAVLLASNSVGICYAGFVTEDVNREEVKKVRSLALEDLKLRTGDSGRIIFNNKTNLFLENAIDFLQGKKEVLPIVLSVRGTDFQLSVWRELLKVPSGSLSSYSKIAGAIGRPNAVRATGTAIGANPVALFIPCHRVIRSSGELGDYRWGTRRKKEILDFETK